MALVLKDRVKETTTTTGTGSFALAGAVTGYDSFGQINDGNTTYYAVYLDGGSEWEVGIGTYTAPSTLSRDTILASSNAGSVVTFSAGQKTIWYRDWETDRKSTRLNSSHSAKSRMPSSA